MAVTQTIVYGDNSVTATVTDTAGGGTAVALDLAGFPHRSVQRTSGTGTYTVEGSNDGVTFGALNTPIAAENSTDVVPIAENARYLQVEIAAAAAVVVIHASR